MPHHMLTNECVYTIYNHEPGMGYLKYISCSLNKDQCNNIFSLKNEKLITPKYEVDLEYFVVITKC